MADNNRQSFHRLRVWDQIWEKEPSVTTQILKSGCFRFHHPPPQGSKASREPPTSSEEGWPYKPWLPLLLSGLRLWLVTIIVFVNSSIPVICHFAKFWCHKIGWQQVPKFPTTNACATIYNLVFGLVYLGFLIVYICIEGRGYYGGDNYMTTCPTPITRWKRVIF